MYGISPHPSWVRRCHQSNTTLATNLQLRFDSSDSSLMMYMQAIVLYRGLGQSPGILNRFVTVTQ